jgi:hypothetical protein
MESAWITPDAKRPRRNSFGAVHIQMLVVVVVVAFAFSMTPFVTVPSVILIGVVSLIVVPAILAPHASLTIVEGAVLPGVSRTDH